MSEFAAWKPVLSALLLPPGLLLILLLPGLRLSRTRRFGVLVPLLLVLLLWFSNCLGTARWLQNRLLKPPPALTQEALTRLRAQAPAPRQPRAIAKVAIVVLGAGRQAHATEYGGPNLTEQGMARLRYGVWLARETGLPLAYSGGVGWSQTGEASEAAAAAHILQQEYGLSLRWMESESRDTRENANLLVPALLSDGVRSIVLVTHAAHMPRAVRAFKLASGSEMEIISAPLGFVTRDQTSLMDWVPTPQGNRMVYDLLHELLGLAIGA